MQKPSSLRNAAKSLLLVLSVFLGSGIMTQAAQKMIIPAYFYPGPLWNQATAAAGTVSTMIMNPASGPGVAPNPAYVNVVNSAQTAGIQILGYVYTDYARRPLADVQAEIDAYRAWYGVDGIFLDETSSGAVDLGYYAAVSDYIRAGSGPTVIMNPGVYPDSGYANLADVLLVFEGSFDTYRYATVPGWAMTLPASKFWHAVYATSTSKKMKSAVTWSRQRNAGNLYVTHDILPNPWDVLPAYWNSELTELRR